MSSTINVGRPPERPIFLIIYSIFSDITNKLGLEVDDHLLYKALWLDFQCDANDSVYLMKMVMIPYLDHLCDAHIFLCGVPNFYSFTMKIGQYQRNHLPYGTQWSDFQCDANDSVYLMKMVMIPYLGHLCNAHLSIYFRRVVYNIFSLDK